MNGYLPAAMIEIQNRAIVAGSNGLGERQCSPSNVRTEFILFADLDRCSCRDSVSRFPFHAGSIEPAGDSFGPPANSVWNRNNAGNGGWHR